MLNRSSGLLAIASLIVFSAALSACTSRPTPPKAVQMTASPLSGKTLQAFHWRLTAATDEQGRSVDTLFPQADRSFVLEFAAAQVAIRGGCNGMGGSYQISGTGVLQVGPLMATRKGCAAALMQADTAMVAVFAQPLQLQMQLEDAALPVLRLVSGQGQTLVWTGTPKP